MSAGLHPPGAHVFGALTDAVGTDLLELWPNGGVRLQRPRGPVRPREAAKRPLRADECVRRGAVVFSLERFPGRARI